MGDVVRLGRVHREATEKDALQVGAWYWLTDEDGERWLGCITELGSNYAEMTSVHGGNCRVHFDRFDTSCEPAPEADAYIASQITKAQTETMRLMTEVRELTARLAIDQVQHEGGETQALARYDGGPVSSYKAALIKAKKEVLPTLFKKIEESNKLAAVWMKAKLIPLKAEAEGMKGAMGAIEDRIFSVELYAGLIEEVVKVRDGAPAPATEPLHLFQRRAYMDEECLVDYQAGGMEFQDIEAFDSWLLKPESLARLMPLPRCMLSFRIRRKEKEREFPSLRAWLNFAFSGQREADMRTFLYIRNGEQMFRLSTGLDFGSKLFPDLTQTDLNQPLMARMFCERVEDLITRDEYDARLARYRREKAEWEAKKKAAKSKEDKEKYDSFWFHPTDRDMDDQWFPFDMGDVRYDDIRKHVKKMIDHHNRIVLILQGLFDRSPALLPHPPVQLWHPESFAQHVRLLYDEDRTLPNPVPPPDWEEYRRRLDATLKVGDWTFGQQRCWGEAEAKKENARRGRWSEHQVTYWEPYGNPGPGDVAQVVRLTKTHATFEWYRERSWQSRGYGRPDNIKCAITVPRERLFNVSGYTPGEFHLFYDDYRTRADYVQWAPFLLTAEDWAAKAKKHRLEAVLSKIAQHWK